LDQPWRKLWFLCPTEELCPSQRLQQTQTDQLHGLLFYNNIIWSYINIECRLIVLLCSEYHEHYWKDISTFLLVGKK
jgi:hypothetical protein